MPRRWPEYFDAPEEAWMDVAGSASLGGQVDASSWSVCQVICELANRIEKLEERLAASVQKQVPSEDSFGGQEKQRPVAIQPSPSGHQ